MAGLIPFNRNRAIRSGDFYNMLDDFFNDAWAPGRNLLHDTFKVDVKEEEDQYWVEAEVPGIQKEEITLDLYDGKLSISIERRKDKEEEKKHYIHRERVYSSMSRSIYLADAANEGITAKLENGILKILVPKTKEKQNRNRIPIE